MAPMMPMHAPPIYAPTDALDRHEYGVTKSRKAASTGGGRAWSEDEEVYLLQTRMQKMPYKHIAAHLKKTELACRLHYHQLSHGSNRRKRTTSVSSGSSTGHSPIMGTTIPSPIHESQSRSTSPPGSSGSYGPGSPHGIHLPSINAASASPRLPAILPKPASMTLALNAAINSPSTCGYPTPLAMPSTAGLPPPTACSASFPHPPHSASGHGPSTPPLRLDCSIPNHQGHQVDMGRLYSAYSAHRSSFWAAIAADYGGDMSPYVLEQAWKTGVSCPITPVASPDGEFMRKVAGDKTRISAILGIDANPRSPKEREIVRRIEEERR
ncbi:hypothetical protein MKZ38_006099 [Zalerion maritima]|uniref:Myb-like domain-containing protein n=1 Tax=Zalerion maritima TaxID=339359 RepID=A0AAD5RVP1_9PEZI|nr:hypothetical protein MKZ38_006099 [Zalerion maritima]